MKQRSFASLSFDAKKKPTRRKKFLGEMDKVVPWEALLALLEPSYPTSGRRGRPPMPTSVMLRIHFMQQSISGSECTFYPSFLASWPALGAQPLRGCVS